MSPIVSLVPDLLPRVLAPKEARFYPDTTPHPSTVMPATRSRGSGHRVTSAFASSPTASTRHRPPPQSSDTEETSLADSDDIASPLLTDTHDSTTAPVKPSKRPAHEAVAFHCFHRPPRHKQSSKLAPQFGKKGVIILLCVINLFNYIDRGIIPGSPEKFQNFISHTLHVEVTRQSFYLGLLASAFIASYSICSMLFGYWATKFRPFRMIALGMSVWVIAVICCGAAHAMDSYYFLMFGRILSGVGEASFQCNATPFINLHAPQKTRALWMGVYLASITVGTAMGYIYGSMFAASSLTWAGAFYVEAIVMVGLILCCLNCVPSELDTTLADDVCEDRLGTPGGLVEDLLHHDKHEQRRHQEALEAKMRVSLEPTSIQPTPGFFSGWWEIFRNPTFTLVVLGHAAYTFSVAGLSIFSPVILIGLGMYETETQVSTAFGGLIVITGTLGTPLGGILLDKLNKRGVTSAADRAYTAVKVIFWMMLVASALALVMMLFTSSRMIFIGVLALCFFFLCMLTTAETVAVMELFPESRHAMAIAANTLVIHALGDVPSPIIIGWLKDTWAPRCGTVEIDGKAVLNPLCHLDHDGLKDVLLFPVLWLLWGVVLWGVATVVLRRLQRYAASTATTPATV